jgi:hypothetical protein
VHRRLKHLKPEYSKRWKEYEPLYSEGHTSVSHEIQKEVEV